MSSYEFTIGEALQALDLISEIAAMRCEGELDDEGNEFVLENDDAWETVHSLVWAARAIVKKGARHET